MGATLSDLLNPADMIASLAAKNREGVLLELTALLSKNHPECSRDAIAKALADREKDGTTGIGNGVAIPHIRHASLKSTLLAVGRSPEGIAFGSLDGKPVHLFFLLLAPEKSNYLKILARMAQALQNEDFREKLFSAETAHDLFQMLKQGF